MEKEELPSSSKRKSETTRESKHVKGQIGKGEWVTHISLPSIKKLYVSMNRTVKRVYLKKSNSKNANRI